MGDAALLRYVSAACAPRTRFESRFVVDDPVLHLARRLEKNCAVVSYFLSEMVFDNEYFTELVNMIANVTPHQGLSVHASIFRPVLCENERRTLQLRKDAFFSAGFKGIPGTQVLQGYPPCVYQKD